MRSNEGQTLEVLFPFTVLRPDSKILDVENTESTFEYYLLENLGSGLLRDNPKALDGYAPLLAESWEGIGTKEWHFHIRSDLKWSDGSAILGSQLCSHFEHLRQSHSRHLSLMSQIEKVAFDEPKNVLLFQFRKNIGTEFLHELSLADAVLVHPAHPDWKVTSGAYYVDTYDLDKRELILKGNRHSGLLDLNSPLSVRLFPLQNVEQLEQVFEKIPVDLFYLPPPSFRALYDMPKQKAAAKSLSNKSLLHFLVFNFDNPKVKNLKFRKYISEFISSTLSSCLKTNESYEYFGQMIPKGYAGTLPDYEKSNEEIDSTFLQEKIQLQFNPAVKEIPKFESSLRDAAKRRGIDLVITYSIPIKGQINAGAKTDTAREVMFQGNQKDPLGSWNFLFSNPDGVLARTKSDVIPEFSAIANAKDESSRLISLERLHRKILDEALVIPFLLESNTALLSNRISIEEWNPFDFRLRFYQVRWK